MNVYLENVKSPNIFRMYCSCIHKQQQQQHVKENKQVIPY